MTNFDFLLDDADFAPFGEVAASAERLIHNNLDATD